jgi:hypothetical protein
MSCAGTFKPAVWCPAAAKVLLAQNSRPSVAPSGPRRCRRRRRRRATATATARAAAQNCRAQGSCGGSVGAGSSCAAAGARGEQRRRHCATQAAAAARRSGRGAGAATRQARASGGGWRQEAAAGSSSGRPGPSAAESGPAAGCTAAVDTSGDETASGRASRRAVLRGNAPTQGRRPGGPQPARCSAAAVRRRHYATTPRPHHARAQPGGGVSAGFGPVTVGSAGAWRCGRVAAPAPHAQGSQGQGAYVRAGPQGGAR